MEMGEMPYNGLLYGQLMTLIWTAEGERGEEKTTTAPKSSGSSGRSPLDGREEVDEVATS